jgi:uncharacterized protein (TIGR03437 family)
MPSKSSRCPEIRATPGGRQTSPSEVIKPGAVTFHLLFTRLRVLAFITLSAAALPAQTVRFHTSLGDIDVNLAPDAAPGTVGNFLNYVNTGAYTNTIIHRIVPGFVVQGGGYIVKNHLPFLFQPNDPVGNEFKISNTRGTIAMALQGTDINSAQDQWFFNLVDNSSTLDSQKFTVFGNIANDAGLAVMDALGAIPNFTFASLTNFPLINYTAGRTVQDTNFVYVTSIAQLSPGDSAAGVLSAASFTPSSTAGISPGEMITIFGKDFGPSQVTTLQLDSTGTTVTTSLAGTRVLFDGTPGPMVFTSSTQLSVIAPYNLAGKTTVNVIVEYQGTQTTPIPFKVIPVNPGIFTLSSTGKGDAAIVRLDGSIVSTASPALPGDSLSLYGEGYGVPTQSPLPDGAVVSAILPQLNNTQLLIDGKPAETSYTGGAPGDVNGVLQINFKVPALTAGAHQIQVQVGSTTISPAANLQTR